MQFDIILFHFGGNIIVSVTDIISDIGIRAMCYRIVGHLKCPRILPWWRLDLSLRGMQILHKLYTLDVGRRTCMRFKPTRRQQARQARGQPNATPSSFAFVRFLSLFFSLLEYLVRWMTTLDIRVDMPVPERQEWRAAKMTRVLEENWLLRDFVKYLDIDI